eukprot:CAMPEP_0168833966 /NCGR_PEP_ID=MMETSP0727-20121128/3342_1 /TAXON_ID=265536 /ORGANISM="Amphiprora sp., Strain CCMP467" /LENGTH=213 /DNA_ID=CAMNT_0008887291 /DNA_START=44 /DNA_END=685 /DNA_ORIENTATION=-
MGLLQRFTNHKKKEDKSEFSETESTSKSSRTSKRSIRSSGGSIKSPGSTSHKVPSSVKAKTPKENLTEKVIQDLYALVSDKGCTAEKIVEMFASPETPIFHEDIPTTTAQVFAQIIMTVRLSFPDSKFTADVKQAKPGVVLADDSTFSGTFTGVDFQALPSVAPLTANDRQVILDPERVYFTVENGKIAKMEVIAMGCHTGVGGIYVLAGGEM